MTARLILLIEFLILCIFLPSFIIFYRLAPYMLLFLWSACAACWLIYRHYHTRDLKKIWNWPAVTWPHVKPVLIRWALASLAMLVFLYFYDPGHLFYIVKHRPGFVPFLLVLYPLLSALPQEFIFCTFFFNRYAPLFKTDATRIFVSACVFAYAHILFINPVAPTLSFFGGLIFASTFARHRSLALVTIEHGLYGNALFLIGLGWYFYGGSVH